MSYRVISSTMGVSTPATVSQDAAEDGRYHYRGDKKWPRDRSAYKADPEPGVAPPGLKGSKERKRERLDAFEAALRDLGYDAETATPKAVLEAGKRAGVRVDTARVYRRELLERQPQGKAS